MPSPLVYRLINGYINGSTIKVGQGRKAFYGFTPTIDIEPLFYGFTPTIETEPFLFTILPRLLTQSLFFFGFAPTLPRFLTNSHKKGTCIRKCRNLERMTRLELATSTLARWRSTR